MNTVYFLSDVHLGAGPPELDGAKSRDVVTFLDRLGRGDILYLLGDVFDFWFDFHGEPPALYGPLLDALAAAVRRGARISFMGGNHDYWARAGHGPRRLEREIGASGFLAGDDEDVEGAPREQRVDQQGQGTEPGGHGQEERHLPDVERVAYDSVRP